MNGNAPDGGDVPDSGDVRGNAGKGDAARTADTARNGDAVRNGTAPGNASTRGDGAAPGEASASGNGAARSEVSAPGTSAASGDASASGNASAPGSSSAPARGSTPGAGDDRARAAAAGLTTGAVARRLGVAPTTLRSWDRRYGLGPAVRGDGRHRRWTPADVGLLEHMCGLTARGVPPAEAARLARSRAYVPSQEHPDPHRDLHPDPPHPHPGPDQHPHPPPALVPAPRVPDAGIPVRTVRGLRNAAVRLDSPLLDRLLHTTVQEHGLVGTWHGAMSPALRAIGRTWASSGDSAGEKYVEAEHLLSWHISTALRRGAFAEEPDVDEQPVLLACAPGEMHTLALEALAAALAERGLPARMFGAAVPLGAFAEAVRRTGPRAVVLWSQTRPTADRTLLGLVRSTASGIRGARTQPIVLAAGPGWNRTAPIGGVHRPRSLSDALEVIGAAR